jgi:hypothetical protein
MSETTITPEASLKAEAYLNRLEEAGLGKDAANVRSVVKSFNNVCLIQNRKAQLYAIGGTVSEPLPRKDIDLKITFEKEETGSDERYSYEESLEHFRKDFKPLVDQIAQESGIEIDQTQEPVEEEDLPGILRSEGWVTLRPQGTPIQILSNFQPGEISQLAPAVLMAPQ